MSHGESGMPSLTGSSANASNHGAHPPTAYSSAIQPDGLQEVGYVADRTAEGVEGSHTADQEKSNPIEPFQQLDGLGSSHGHGVGSAPPLVTGL
jgi:hypothetical protein